MSEIAPATTTPKYGDDFPQNWAEFYLRYKDYISYRLYRAGFARSTIEDETMAIVVRLIERDYLAMYDPAKAKFRTLLTNTVKLTSWGVGERIRRQGYREQLCALFGEEEAEPLRLNLTTCSVESYLFDPARMTVALLRVRLVAWPSLLLLFLAIEENLEASEAALARRLGRTKKEVHVDLEALRQLTQEVRSELLAV